MPHFELQGKVLGLIGGSGGIGSKVASLAEALGMKVLITSRSPKPNALPLEELLKTSHSVAVGPGIICDAKYNPMISYINKEYKEDLV